MANFTIEKSDSGLSTRVCKLRERILTTPEVCTERARLMTESYKETEGQPNLLTRALALKKILSEMTVRIDDDELIVGKITSKTRGAPILPEIQWEWIIDEMETLSTRDLDRYAPLAEEEKTLLREILPYWKGKSLFDLWRARVPESALRLDNKIQATGGYCENGHHPAHCSINYERLLAKGLKGIKEEVDVELEKTNYSSVEGLNKYEFLTAVNITLDAVMGFARRYADLAGEMAAKEGNPRRKAELEKIAEHCAWVPDNPPRTFHEALQMIWLVWIALMMEGFGAGMTFGRTDQYLYPLYRKGIDEGTTTEEEIRELISLFYIKMNEVVSIENEAWAQYGSGFPLMLGVTLGGVTSDGRDAVNELSYLFLETDKYLGLTQEDLVIRVHRNNPDKWVIKASEVAIALKGKLKFVGDETVIQGLLAEGKPIEFARDYVSTGCHTCNIPGRSRDIGGVVFNIILMLELALNNGAMRLTGEQIGPKTGDPRQFKSFEEVLQAYTTQLETLFPVARLYKNVELELQAKHTASPFQSALFNDCIKKGLDVTNGGTAPYMVHLTAWNGLPDLADSMAAIKKVVFDDGKITMAQLIDALENNFEGAEEIRHWLSNAPKYGNDDAYVDDIMSQLNKQSAEIVGRHDSYLGFKNVTTAQGMTANIPLGHMMGALPDGRKAGEPMAECISPHQGRSNSGPMSTYRSVAKIDHAVMSHGSVLNMRFSPDTVNDDRKIKKFATMMRTFFETGGNLVQFNFIDAETLKAAQRNPEQHRDLIVRVATYSAYFIELFKESQDDIIARTEYVNL